MRERIPSGFNIGFEAFNSSASFALPNKKSKNTDKKYPCFTREDFFDYLIEFGIERSLAFEAAEQIRKGYASSSNKEQFDKLPIPDDIKKVARNYLYLFPRAHEIEYILLYAQFAYYAKINSRAFSKIIFNKKN